MRRTPRVFGTVLVIVTVGLAGLAGHAAAADPVVDLEGPTHVVTLTSPPIYDLSTNASSSEGDIESATLITQDQKGNIEGDIVDKGSDVLSTTTITGTIRRSGGVTVIKEKMIGEGDVGNGDGFERDSPFARSGDWIVRVELEQSPSGELFGFGKIITNVHSSQSSARPTSSFPGSPRTRDSRRSSFRRSSRVGTARSPWSRRSTGASDSRVTPRSSS